MRSAASALAEDVDRPTVQLDQAFDQRQPQAQAAAAARDALVALDEGVEDAGEHLRGNADAGVTDGHARLARRGQRDRHRHGAAAVGEFLGVVQQVPQDLSQPRRLALHPDRAGRRVDDQLQSGLCQAATAVLRGFTHQPHQVEPFALHGDLTAGDARRVQ